MPPGHLGRVLLQRAERHRVLHNEGLRLRLVRIDKLPGAGREAGCRSQQLELWDRCGVRHGRQEADVEANWEVGAGGRLAVPRRLN